MVDAHERLELGRQGDADQFGGAKGVHAEQLAVGQDMVDESGRIDDQIHGVGEALPCLGVEADIGTMDNRSSHSRQDTVRGSRWRR